MIRLRKRLLLILATLATIYTLHLLPISAFLQVKVNHFKYHFHRELYSYGLVSVFTKGPLIQIVDDRHVDVVFELRESLISWHNEKEVYVYYKNTNNMAVTHSAVATGGTPYRARLSTDLATTAITYYVQAGRFTSQTFNCPSIGREVKIGVVGDNQFAAVKFSQIMHSLNRHNPQMLIHVGDAVQEDETRQWQTDFFDIVGSSRPVCMVRGNHDRSKYNLGYSTFTVANTFFLVIDSMAENPGFVERALISDAAVKAHFRVVLVHIPPFIEFWDASTWSEEKAWGEFTHKYVDLYTRHHVDLVLSGHQHNYQRGTLSNVTYVITGGAGGTLDRNRVEQYTHNKVTIIAHHYGVLEITDRLIWRMYTLNGRLRDEIVLPIIND